MKVAVYGLGYVGTVTAAAFASTGCEVVGVDTDEQKVAMLASGRTPVLEHGLAELVAAEVAAGRLTATTDGEAASAGSDVSLICVGTPSAPNGSLSIDAVERVAATIGHGLSRSGTWHTVVLRSTCLPGTTEDVIGVAITAASGLQPGVGFGLAMNPEFLREGSSLADFRDPPKTVVGELDTRSGDTVASLYAFLDAPLFRVPIRVAEMVKYADNTYHAVKVAYANEIGAMCRSLGVDSHAVMNVFKEDRKLNISTAYLTPGFAFGGSCLPKDLRALVHAAGRADVDVPLLGSVLAANEAHLRRTLDAILRSGKRRVAMLGLSFKPGTDDLRESPLVELAERLVGKGFELSIYDPAVVQANLVGANLRYVETHLPHLSALLVEDLQPAVENAEVIIVGAPFPGVEELLRDDQLVVDLVRLPDATRRSARGRYVGAAW